MKNRLMAAAIIPALLWCAAVPATAGQETGRYVLKQTRDGFIRLDTESGSVAHCSQSNGKWHCDSLEKERTDVQQEIARLEQQNSLLKGKITRLEAKLRELSRNNTKPKSKLELPSDEELDQIMGFFEKLVTRFMQFARTLQGAPGEDI